MATDLGMYVEVKASGINQVNAGLDKMAKKADGAEKSAINLSNAIAGIASFAAIKKVMGMADSYASMSARMKLATSSTKEFVAVQNHLLNTANKAGRSMSELQNIFIDTSGNLQDMGYSMKDTLKMTDSLSYAFTRNATSAQRAQGALEAWDFALNKKQIDVRTWQRLSTAIPTLEIEMARVYGKSLSEIQQLGFAGQLSVEMVNNTLLESYDENVRAAQLMGSSIESATNMLSNNFQALVGDIDSGLGATAAVAASIELIAENIDLLLIPATGIAVIGIVKGFTLAKTAVVAFNASLMANPITMVVAGLAMGVTTLYALTREAEETTHTFEAMNQSMDDVIDGFRELGSIQRKSYVADYKNKQIGAMQEMENSIDSLVKKMATVAQAEGAAEKKNSGSGYYMRATYIKEAESRIREAISSGKDLLEVVDEFAKYEEIDSILSDMLLEDIKNLDIASGAVNRYNEALERLSIEQGTFVGPFQLSVDNSESKAYLDMQESITNQIMKQNLKGLEGNVIYERAVGVLKDISREEYETLQLRARSVDVQAQLLAQQNQIALKVEDINDRYEKIGKSALQAEIFDLEKMGLAGEALDDAKAKLEAIYGAVGGGSLSIGGSDAFTDRLVSLSQDLSAMQALNLEMEKYGQASKYNAVKELTLEFENQASALYKLSSAQKEALLIQAEQLDGQRQLNEILSMAYSAEQSIDDLIFEAEMVGKLSSEVDKLKFFRDLDTKAKEISIGMSAANVAILNEEIEKIKELYEAYGAKKQKDDNDPIQGMKDGLASFTNEAGTARDAFKDATEGALNSMTSGLADFVATGKMNFKDLTRSILQDIAKIMAQWAIAQAVTGMLGGLSSSGGAKAYPYLRWDGGYVPEYANGGAVNDLSSGGFTGQGGKYEPKGIVHGGEYVFSKERVEQLGLKNLDALHKGYSTGGFVGNASTGGKPSNAGVVVNQSINIEAGSSIDDKMIAMLKYEMQQEAEEIAQKVSINSMTEQKKHGGMLRG